MQLPVIKLEPASEENLRDFVRMEREADTKDLILPYDYETHQKNLANPQLIYLKITADGSLAGFFILAMDDDGVSVEFRRIVVSIKGKGIGQLAIEEMEKYCRNDLKRSRIWLDVFEENSRGRHIYEKFGYRKFSESELNGRKLLLYEKQFVF